MFHPLFLDHYKNWCACKSSCPSAPQNFDFIINCRNDRYGIEKVKGMYNRVIAIRVFKEYGAIFEPFQRFCASQFHGSFFANVRVGDRYHHGASDIIADVYDAASFPVGTVVLVNNCCIAPCSSEFSEPCMSSDHFKPCPSDRPPYTLSDNCIHLHVCC
jgi:hypothetical protein